MHTHLRFESLILLERLAGRTFALQPGSRTRSRAHHRTIVL